MNKQTVWYLYDDGPPTDGTQTYSSPPSLFSSMEGALRYYEQVVIGREKYGRMVWWCPRPGYIEGWDPLEADQTVHLAETTIDEDCVFGHGYPSSPSVLAPQRCFHAYEAAVDFSNAEMDRLDEGAR